MFWLVLLPIVTVTVLYSVQRPNQTWDHTYYKTLTTKQHLKPEYSNTNTNTDGENLIVLDCAGLAWIRVVLQPNPKATTLQRLLTRVQHVVVLLPLCSEGHQNQWLPCHCVWGDQHSRTNRTMAVVTVKKRYARSWVTWAWRLVVCLAYVLQYYLLI